MTIDLCKVPRSLRALKVQQLTSADSDDSEFPLKISNSHLERCYTPYDSSYSLSSGSDLSLPSSSISSSSSNVSSINIPTLSGRVIPASTNSEDPASEYTQLQLISPLGAGNYGQVYLACALQRAPAGSVAVIPMVPNVLRAVKCVKVISDDEELSPEDSELSTRFEIESSVHADLCAVPKDPKKKKDPRSEQIVQFFSTSSDLEYEYLVIEYTPEGDLFSAIFDQAMFVCEGELIKTIFSQIVDAVSFCHDQNIFHRDIKPENVLLFDNHGGLTAKLCDFGLCSDEEWSMSFRLGTYAYQSPECYNFEETPEPFNHRHSDIWSLGMVLYNMVFARHLWTAPSCEDMTFQRYTLEPDAKIFQPSQITRMTWRIIRGILNVEEPSKRTSLKDLRACLETLEDIFPE